MRTVHVYDFDNTLFLSPLPNPKLWSGPSLGQLQQLEVFVNGGEVTVLYDLLVQITELPLMQVGGTIHGSLRRLEED